MQRYNLRERKPKQPPQPSPPSLRPSPRKAGKKQVVKKPWIGPKGLTEKQIETLRRSQRPPRRRWPRQDPPITNPEDIPDSWNWDMNDLDLDEDDVEGNIQRCHERIEEGILPQIFERKLKMFERLKAAHDEEMASEPQELGSWVITRLNTLKKMEPDLLEHDPYNHLPIVRALIKAYRSGELKEPVDGKVTYWSEGRMVAGPKKWDYDDYRAIHREHGCPRSFWVEVVGSPEPVLMAAVCMSLPILGIRAWSHAVLFEIRIPGTPGGSVFQFMDDTGAAFPTMWEEDGDSLMEKAPPGTEPPAMSSVTAMNAFGGDSTFPAMVLEGRVLGNDLTPWTKWQRLFIMFQRKTRLGQQRLSGFWWRYMLFTATWPSRDGAMVWADNQRELCNQIPGVHPLLGDPPTVPPTLPPPFYPYGHPGGGDDGA